MKSHQHFAMGLFWAAGSFIAAAFSLFWLMMIGFIAALYCLIRGVWVLSGHEYRANGIQQGCEWDAKGGPDA